MKSSATFSDPRHAPRGERDQPAQAPRRDQHGERAAGGREQRALGRELPGQATAARAERLTDRHLLPPSRRTREDQVRDVHARDQQQQANAGTAARTSASPRRRPGRPAAEPRAVSSRFAPDSRRETAGSPWRRNPRVVPAPVRSVTPGCSRARQPSRRRRLRLRRTGAAPRNPAGLQTSTSLWTRAAGMTEPWRHHADDLNRVGVDDDRPPDGRRIGAQPPAPEAVAHDRDVRDAGVSSSGPKIRPCAGATPRTEK